MGFHRKLVPEPQPTRGNSTEVRMDVNELRRLLDDVTAGRRTIEALDRVAGGLSRDDLREDGLLRFTEAGLEVTPVGSPLLRVIAMRFDPLFTSAPRRHAQAI